MMRYIPVAVAIITVLGCGPSDNSRASQSGTVTLQRRAQSEYGKSAYSFRYGTQDKSAHKNLVDVVYSANGMLRINNAGNMTSRIADLGVRNEPLAKQLGEVTDWTTSSLRPVAGHSYALEINVDDDTMTVVFQLTEVSADEIKLEWTPTDYDEWPVAIDDAGVAGVSGMNQ